MTTLNSLRIRGIRSFTPDRNESLEFEKPLTLIVGKNGSGKTTLVECLKAVTCGILPPGNLKGRNFISDHKLNRSSEVQASIRMTFNNHKDETICASREYTLSCDKFDPKKVIFKGTDSTLTIKSMDGGIRNLALKTTDMDIAVPSLMGMSRALLDNVIFCHQDENNWPLDDPNKVKARFDDLLETSRYTKALQALHKAKKEQEDMIISKKSKLDAYKAQILQMADLRKQLESDRDEIEKTKAEIQLLQSNLDKMATEIVTIRKEYEEASAIFKEFKTTEATCLKLKEECDALHEQLSEIYEEPLEDMKKYHMALAEEIKTSESKYEALTKTVEELSENINNYHEKLRIISSTENNMLILKEKLKMNETEIELIKGELCKEFEVNPEEFQNELISSKIESVSKGSGEEETFREELAKVQHELNELKSTIMNSTAEIAAFKVMLKTVNAEIKESEKTMTKFNKTNKIKGNLDSEIAHMNNEMLLLQDNLRELLDAKEKMLCKRYRMKNFGEIKNMSNEEIMSGIKFLNYILENDSETTETYNTLLSKHQLDEHKLTQIIQKIFDELMIDDDNLVHDVHETINQMQKSSIHKILCQNCGTNVEVNLYNLYLESYNKLLSILTNNKIKEYISYFEVVLKHPEQTDSSSTDDFDEDKYNKILEDIVIIKKQLLDKRIKMEHNNKELEAVLLKLNNMSGCEERLANLKEKKSEILQNIDTLSEEVKRLEGAVKEKNEQLNGVNLKLKEAENYRNMKYNKFKMMYDDMLNTVTNNTEIETQLNELMKNTNELSCVKIDIDQLTNDLKNNKNTQAKLMSDINDKRNVIQTLVDNINYKYNNELLLENRAKMEQLQQQLSGRNVHEIKNKFDELNDESLTLSHQIATMNGILMSKEENIDKLNKMLEDNVFSKIQTLYMETYIELKSHLIAKSDLEKYSKHLELSLHNYHLKKINYINSALKRIWREVYTGNHIDYIQIQSKVDKDLSFMDIPSNSYYYKLVMVTPSGTEMDMKGHCSAGERILSSLVVRMALIECFSTNCSILALDEPTTNLDKHNIQGLENSLTKLVNESGVNFQLIIITHNEGFARKMATLCSCDKYLTLDKNESYTQIKTVTL